MLHTITNEHLTCSILAKGAEIRSLTNNKTGQEYIWQINPEVWRSSSPPLFPAIGTIKEGTIIYKETAYPMTKHGIARDNDHFIYKQLSPSSCSFTLSHNEDTLVLYPFKFSFTITYILEDNRLLMAYEVVNLDTVPMYFTFGGHTAYACPVSDKKELSDYVIEFPEAQNLSSLTLDNTGLLTSVTRDINTDGALLSLSKSLFNKDALIFSDIDYNWVRLREKSKTKGIIVRFTGYQNLALWAQPGADYVCIEPWLGLPDAENESLDITKKSTYTKLEPQKQLSRTIETIVE
ncbi:aldose 1-epimerase family protein [Dokdonia sp. LLG6352-1]|uniref:aldose 1-epimerase family protein n=1 Tax=Dokdonia sp. LLG6352-1 TaxID=3160831 RepID=UPI00386DE69C